MAKRRKRSRKNNGFWMILGIALFALVMVIIIQYIYAVIAIVLAALAAIISIRVWKRKKSIRLVEERRRRLLEAGIDQVDVMKGEKFEEFLAALFQTMGFETKLTAKTGDFGADVILTGPSGSKSVVQAKRYDKNVGVEAIQQVVAAKAHYGAKEAISVTNQYYSENAKELAKSNGVRLIDRDALITMIINVKRKEVEKSII